MKPDLAELTPRLERFVSDATGGPAHVTRARPLAGGASSDMFAVDLTIDDGPHRGSHALVLRRDLGGQIYEQSLDRALEYRVIQAAHAAGVMVPKVRWASADAGVIGSAFFLQDRVDGETIGRRVVKEPALEAARAGLAAQMASELAKIHAVDVTRLEFLPRPKDGQSAADHDVALLYAQLDRIGEPHPALELALRWLSRNAPPPAPMTLVHGDFRVGNVIVGPEGLRGVLDWEFAHVGDPMEDVSWPLVRAWRFGADALEMGGVGARAAYLDAYAKASGRAIDARVVRYWEIMGTVKWAVGCIAQAERHLKGEAKSVELASLGRKTAEMELDALDLLDVARDASPARAPCAKEA